MILINRPLMPIFGDIRAFQCQPCGFLVLLQYPFELLSTIEGAPLEARRGLAD
jgi:hypothetical protein